MMMQLHYNFLLIVSSLTNTQSIISVADVNNTIIRATNGALDQKASQMPPESSNTAISNPINQNSIKLLLYNVKALTEQLLGAFKDPAAVVNSNIPLLQAQTENKQSYPNAKSNHPISVPSDPVRIPPQHTNNVVNTNSLETRKLKDPTGPSPETMIAKSDYKTVREYKIRNWEPQKDSDESPDMSIEHTLEESRQDDFKLGKYNSFTKNMGHSESTSTVKSYEQNYTTETPLATNKVRVNEDIAIHLNNSIGQRIDGKSEYGSEKQIKSENKFQNERNISINPLNTNTTAIPIISCTSVLNKSESLVKTNSSPGNYAASYKESVSFAQVNTNVDNYLTSNQNGERNTNNPSDSHNHFVTTEYDHYPRNQAKHLFNNTGQHTTYLIQKSHSDPEVNDIGKPQNKQNIDDLSSSNGRPCSAQNKRSEFKNETSPRTKEPLYQKNTIHNESNSYIQQHPQFKQSGFQNQFSTYKPVYQRNYSQIESNPYRHHPPQHQRSDFRRESRPDTQQYQPYFQRNYYQNESYRYQQPHAPDSQNEFSLYNQQYLPRSQENYSQNESNPYKQQNLPQQQRSDFRGESRPDTQQYQPYYQGINLQNESYRIQQPQAPDSQNEFSPYNQQYRPRSQGNYSQTESDPYKKQNLPQQQRSDFQRESHPETQQFQPYYQGNYPQNEPYRYQQPHAPDSQNNFSSYNQQYRLRSQANYSRNETDPYKQQYPPEQQRSDFRGESRPDTQQYQPYYQEINLQNESYRIQQPQAPDSQNKFSPYNQQYRPRSQGNYSQNESDPYKQQNLPQQQRSDFRRESRPETRQYQHYYQRNYYQNESYRYQQPYAPQHQQTDSQNEFSPYNQQYQPHSQGNYSQNESDPYKQQNLPQQQRSDFRRESRPETRQYQPYYQRNYYQNESYRYRQPYALQHEQTDSQNESDPYKQQYLLQFQKSNSHYESIPVVQEYPPLYQRSGVRKSSLNKQEPQKNSRNTYELDNPRINQGVRQRSQGISQSRNNSEPFLGRYGNMPKFSQYAYNSYNLAPNYGHELVPNYGHALVPNNAHDDRLFEERNDYGRIPAPLTNHDHRTAFDDITPLNVGRSLSDKITSEEEHLRRVKERAYFRKKMWYMVHRYGDPNNELGKRIDSWCTQCEHDTPTVWCGCSRSCGDSLKGWRFEDYSRLYPRQRSIAGLYRCRFRKFIHDNFWYLRESFHNLVDDFVPPKDKPKTSTHRPNGWIAASNGIIPLGAFIGAQFENDHVIYVVKAFSGAEDGWVPGMLIDREKCARVASGRDEMCLHNYEVLIGSSYSWLAIDATNFQNGPHPDRLSSGRYHICRIQKGWYIVTYLDLNRGCYVAPKYRKHFGQAPFYRLDYEILID